VDSSRIADEKAAPERAAFLFSEPCVWAVFFAVPSGRFI
jgi:hypothetical protein